MTRYDNLSKGELISEIQKLKLELLVSRSEKKELNERCKDVYSERPGYLWRYSDERVIALKKGINDLQAMIDSNRAQQDYIRRELEYISRAESGYCDKNLNYYEGYDDTLYLRELERKGYISGLKI
jgi:hypothetical protein